MAQGDRFRAVGGTVTLPLSVIKVNGGRLSKRALIVQNITGPGDEGNVVFDEGNYVYEFSLRGVYVEGVQASDTTNDAVRGSATISLGNGEEWTGTVIIRNVISDSDWGPGGDVGVILNGTFTGAVTVTQPGS